MGIYEWWIKQNERDLRNRLAELELERQEILAKLARIGKK